MINFWRVANGMWAIAFMSQDDHENADKKARIQRLVKLIPTTIFLLSMSISTPVASFTGEQFYMFQESYETYKEYEVGSMLQNGFYAGYIKGVVDILQAQEKICLSKETTAENILDHVSKFMSDNPEFISLPALITVTGALKEAYEC